MAFSQAIRSFELEELASSESQAPRLSVRGNHIRDPECELSIQEYVYPISGAFLGLQSRDPACHIIPQKTQNGYGTSTIAVHHKLHPKA